MVMQGRPPRSHFCRLSKSRASALAGSSRGVELAIALLEIEGKKEFNEDKEGEKSR